MLPYTKWRPNWGKSLNTSAARVFVAVVFDCSQAIHTVSRQANTDILTGQQCRCQAVDDTFKLMMVTHSALPLSATWRHSGQKEDPSAERDSMATLALCESSCSSIIQCLLLAVKYTITIQHLYDKSPVRPVLMDKFWTSTVSLLKTSPVSKTGHLFAPNIYT